MAIDHALKRTGKFYDAGGAEYNVMNPDFATGAKLDDSTDDTAAFAAAFAAATAAGGGVVGQPEGTGRITAALTQTLPLIIQGRGLASVIRNMTSGAHVLELNTTPIASFIAPVVRNIKLKGTGTTSRALDVDLVQHGIFENIDCIDHPGTAVYLYSSNAGILQGCAFCELRNVLAQPSGAVNAIVDDKGINNRFKGIRAREAEIGILLLNVIGASLEGCYIESNTRGTAKVGLRCQITGATSSTQTPSVVSVKNTYFEFNTNYAIRADEGYYVVADGCFISGGVDAVGKLAQSVVKLDGGGRIINCNGASGAKLESDGGLIEVRGSYNVVGKTSEVYFADVMPPFSGRASNAVSKSWFDTDPAWVAGGTTPPTVAADTAVGFLGTKSKKITFTTAALSFSASRVYMSNAELAVTNGLPHYSVIAFKADVAGEVLAFRHDGAAGQDKTINVITTTDWQILIMMGIAAGTGNCGVYCYMPTAPAGTINVWIGGLARSLTPDIALTNGEGPSLTENATGMQNAVVDGKLTLAGVFALKDGITAPATVAGQAQVYVDTADGDLKIKFGDGTVKTITVDT